MILLKILNVESRSVPFSALAPFLLIAFGLAWGLFVLFALCVPEVVRFDRKAMLSREGAVSAVVPGEGAA